MKKLGIEDFLVELTNHRFLPYVLMIVCFVIMVWNPTEVQWERDYMRWVEMFNDLLS